MSMYRRSTGLLFSFSKKLLAMSTTLRFRSFDEYAAALGHADLRFVALDRARAPWTSCLVDLDGVLVRRAQDGGPCLLELAVAADGVGLVFGINAAGKLTGNGKLFGPDSVMVIPGRTEVRSTSLDAVQWMSVFVPASRFTERRDGNSVLHGIRSGVMGPRAGGRTIRALMTRVARAATAGSFTANARARAEAAVELTEATRDLLRLPAPVQEADTLPGRPTKSRSEIMQQVHEWLEEHAAAKSSLRDLASVAGVSTRTLHNVFQEQLGVSPTRFLRIRLLNTLHRELRRAGDEGLMVTDVFTRLGIWNWGRVAGRYHALFGEFPADTVRERARRRPFGRAG
jgi:AraC family ethanolamine operon transcriptional activator